MLTLIEYFNGVTHGKWVTAGMNIQYKVENNVLYFQSSDKGLSDCLVNFDFPVVPYKSMEETFFVHRGFLKAWKSVQDEISKLSYDTIVGYSHGAALALLAHEDFLFKRGLEPATYVFGCPKIFFLISKRAKSRFSKVVNVANVEDIVAKAPPFYTAVGRKIRLVVQAVRPADVTFLQWWSGHMPTMYRQRLAGFEL